MSEVVNSCRCTCCCSRAREFVRGTLVVPKNVDLTSDEANVLADTMVQHWVEWRRQHTVPHVTPPHVLPHTTKAP